MKEQGLKGRRRVKGEFIYIHIHIGLCYLDADREDVEDVVVN